MSVVEVAQRVGRYAYRKVKIAVTNPDHNKPAKDPKGSPLPLADKYVDGRPGIKR